MKLARIAFLSLLTLAGCQDGGSVDGRPEISRAEILSEHNRVRFQNRLTTLDADPELERGAQAWAEEMARKNSLTHARLDMSGTRYSRMAENIAMGFDTAPEAVRGWMGSAGHRRNILEPRHTHAGFGVAADGHGRLWWCARFGGR